MARYSGTAETDSASVGAIDVIAAAASIIPSAEFASAFMPVANIFQAPRQGILGQQGALTWAAYDLDTSVGPGSGGPTEIEYTPAGLAYICTGHVCDAVLTQYAMADHATHGKDLTEAVIEEGAIGYAKYFDSKCAALHDVASTSSPDHLIGADTATLSAPLVDAGIELGLIAGWAEPFALVIHTAKISELMAIPGMRDRAVRGQAGPGGIEGPTIGVYQKKLVAGYGGILDVYHTDQIVNDAPGYQNMMFSAANDPNKRGIAAPFHPLYGPNGQQGKMLIDPAWQSAERSWEINMTTQETFVPRTGTATAGVPDSGGSSAVVTIECA